MTTIFSSLSIIVSAICERHEKMAIQVRLFRGAERTFLGGAIFNFLGGMEGGGCHMMASWEWKHPLCCKVSPYHEHLEQAPF